MSPHIATMATKKEKLSFIENLSSEEILKLIPHDVINKLVLDAGVMKAYLNNASEGHIAASPQSSTQSQASLEMAGGPPAEGGKAMRPLNAFIAFRSNFHLYSRLEQLLTHLGYYKTMFRGIQQKEVSSYLTLLWGKDPFRNKWVLLGKVYSFVRDEVGKAKAPLGDFLAIACPIMGIIEPAEYLRLLGWVQTQDGNGNSMISQDESIAQATFLGLEDQQHPNTELELLDDCIRIGYLPGHGKALTTKLASKSNAIMTPSSGLNDESVVTSKIFDAVFSDSVGAAADLLGLCRDSEIFENGIEVLTMDQDIQRSKSAVSSFIPGPFQDSMSSSANMAMDLLQTPEHSPAISVHNLPIGKTYDMRDLASVEEFVKDNNQGYHDNFFWRYDNGISH